MNRSAKEQLRFFGFSLLLAILLMTVGSMTSFLYPLHTGVDQNCFLSVAKAMADGAVLYADIFEQKGPLLYALHLPAALLPKLRFFGVYLVQIASWIWFFYGVRRLNGFYLPKHYAYPVAAISGLIIVTAFCYSRGDNAEEYCLPLMMVSLADLLYAARAEDQADGLTAGRILKNGILAGCVLWIKFTMLGFYIGWCVLVGCMLWQRKGFLSALRAAGLVLSGMLIATLPWLIYFASNHALWDWMYVYFYSNIALYPRSITLWQRIVDFFGKDILWNPVMMPLILFGAGYCCRSKMLSPTRWSRISVVVTLCFLYLFVFIGGVRYRYYLLILGVFVPIGVIALLHLLRQHTRPIRMDRSLRIAACGGYLAVLLAAGNCLYYMEKPDAYYPQIQFAKIMAETPNATLLNYGFLDGGFHLMSNAPLPESDFFCKLNIPREHLPLMYEEQERLITEAATDYIVLRWEMQETMEERYRFADLYQNYQLLAVTNEVHDAYCYALFVRIQ